MASPKLEVLFFYDIATGAPLTGLSPVFDTYKDTDGNPVGFPLVLPDPVISEIGGGAYAFEPTFPDADKGIVYVVSADNASATPARYSRYIRPEDWNTDNSDVASSSIYDHLSGKWQIFTSGPDANRLVLYESNGVTVLKKYDLFDKFDDPTSQNPYKRVPV